MSKSAVVRGCLLLFFLLCLGMACQNKQEVANPTPLVITVEVPVTVEVMRVEFVEVTAVPDAIARTITTTIDVSGEATVSPTTAGMTAATPAPAATATFDWQASGVFTATSPISRLEPPVGLRCPGMTQMAMNFCAAEDAYKMAREVDKLMTYFIQLNRSEEWIQRLLLSHESWETYKMYECNWVMFQSGGGSIEPLLYYGCIADKNEQRVQELRFTSCVFTYPSPHCDQDE